MASFARQLSRAEFREQQRSEREDQTQFQHQPRPLQVSGKHRDARESSGTWQGVARTDDRSSPELDGDYLTVTKKRGAEGERAGSSLDGEFHMRESSATQGHRHIQGPILNKLTGLGWRLSRRISSSSRGPSEHVQPLAGGGHNRNKSWSKRRSGSADSKPLATQYSSGCPSPGTIFHQRSSIISPHVTVAAEYAAIEMRQKEFWVAVNVSGRLFKSHIDKGGDFGGAGSNEATPCNGFLKNVVIDVLPTQGATIKQVVTEHTFPTIIYPGSSVTLLVRVQVDTTRSDSAEERLPSKMNTAGLIRQLEVQLGAAYITYMQVEISYMCSELPVDRDNVGMVGLVNTASSVKTIYTARIRCYSDASSWSKSPVPKFNPLFSTMMHRMNEPTGQHIYLPDSGDSTDSEMNDKVDRWRACATSALQSAGSNNEDEGTSEALLSTQSQPAKDAQQKWWLLKHGSFGMLKGKCGNSHSFLPDDI